MHVIQQMKKNRHVDGFLYGGEGGIRTLDGLLTHTPLAGERLRPLGHLSVFCGEYSPKIGANRKGFFYLY